jgi:uncharacterized protein YbaP (TraB family)
MISAYKCGNVNALESVLYSDGQFEEDSEFATQLLFDRNEQMAAVIADTLKSSGEKSFFAILGFSHWLFGVKV